MAANRFATMLHRNTNKITLILIYAVLEWILILLLLLNSLFSYLIVKFAEFFGLQPPCPWCTRIDHLFDPAKGGNNPSRDFLCEVHSKEISKLGFCSNHRKLGASQELCGDCLSRPEAEPRYFGLLGKVKEFGDLQSGEVCLNCSCCGAILGNSNNNDKYSSYVLLKTSSWDDVLECAQKQNLITESLDYDGDDEKGSGFVADLCDDENVLENKSDDRNLGSTEKGTEENGVTHETVDLLRELGRGENEILEENLDSIPKEKSAEEDAPHDISSGHLDFFLDYSGHKLVPVDLIDLVTGEHKIEEVDVTKDREVCVDSEAQVVVKEEVVVVESGSKVENTFLDFDMNEEPKYELLDSMEIEKDGDSLVFATKGSHLETEELEDLGTFSLGQWPSEEAGEVQEAEENEKHADVQTACEEASQGNNENEGDVSIGTEIPDLDITEEIQIKDSGLSYEPVHEDPSTNFANLCAVNDQGHTQVEEQVAETQFLPVHEKDNITNNEPSVQMQLKETEEDKVPEPSVQIQLKETEEDKVPEPSVQMQLKETEEDKVPDTPTSMESLNPDKNLSLLFEKRDYMTEESLDGSITSELDGGDGVVTIENLKSALKSERKALQALYIELEEERSASAVATNQTMAMINRLQEEKAAMQMEALQYQRMMDEQSEYDQEALQLLNEVMVKREKEKQELERELEAYKKKLSDYDIKEKMRILKKRRDRSFRSSASCSNGEDSDGVSVELNQEAKEEEGIYGISDSTNQNTPVNAVVNLEESLVDFEEERLSILEHLKVLEEKLLMLDDENEQSFEDVKEMNENGDHLNGESNGYLNSKHHYRRVSGQKGKSLIPLFNAISDENGDLMMNGNGLDHDSYEPKYEMAENKKVAIEEAVDHLFERLQALEADREFLKHCISSLNKGDKGMYLLQEILQHLRDLRSVELHVRNFGDDAVI